MLDHHSSSDATSNAWYCLIEYFKGHQTNIELYKILTADPEFVRDVKKDQKLFDLLRETIFKTYSKQNGKEQIIERDGKLNSIFNSPSRIIRTDDCLIRQYHEDGFLYKEIREYANYSNIKKLAVNLEKLRFLSLVLDFSDKIRDFGVKIYNYLLDNYPKNKTFDARACICNSYYQTKFVEVHYTKGNDEKRKCHRAGGPAITTLFLTEIWMNMGIVHRDDGPAIIFLDGSKIWVKNGIICREDGNSIEFPEFSVDIEGQLFELHLSDLDKGVVIYTNFDEKGNLIPI